MLPHQNGEAIIYQSVNCKLDEQKQKPKFLAIVIFLRTIKICKAEEADHRDSEF